MSNSVILQAARRQQWLAFRNPVTVVAASSLEAVQPALRQAEALVDERRLYAAGFISYEAAPAFDRSFRVRPPDPDFPLLWFGLYAAPEVVPASSAEQAPLDGHWLPSVGRADYDAAIACIKDHIALGDTYQVNYTLRLAPGAVDSAQHWLYHKTTRRQTYAAAQAACPEADDVLLWNERGEATETCVGNVVARVDGRLVTPPLSSGLLPGTLRACLLERSEIAESVLRVEDLGACELFRINSLRGWQSAVLERS